MRAAIYARVSTDEQATEARLTALRAELDACATAGATLRQWPALEADARRALAELAAMFRRDTPGAREVLARLLAGPLVCEPIRHEGKRRYFLRGRAVLPAEIGIPASRQKTASLERITHSDGFLDIAALAA